MNILLGDYIEVNLRDGTIVSGILEKVGKDHIVIEEDRAFGDWICIYYADIIDIEIK